MPLRISWAVPSPPTAIETAIVLRVGFAGELGGVTRSCGGDHVDVQAVLAQARDRRAGEFSRAPAAGRGIDDGEKCFSHEGAALPPLTTTKD